MTLPAQNFACIEKAVENACRIIPPDVTARRWFSRLCILCGEMTEKPPWVCVQGGLRVCADCAQAALAADVMENSQ